MSWRNLRTELQLDERRTVVRVLVFIGLAVESLHDVDLGRIFSPKSRPMSILHFQLPETGSSKTAPAQLRNIK